MPAKCRISMAFRDVYRADDLLESFYLQGLLTIELDHLISSTGVVHVQYAFDVLLSDSVPYHCTVYMYIGHLRLHRTDVV